MFKIVIILFLSLAFNTTFAQKNRKLTKDEMTKMTPEQRLVHESNRKSKNGKKDLSNKKKVKIQKKTSRKSEKIKPPKRQKR
ncbi:MAG: hypothetical protein JNM57_09375 [Cyclobacteriaceae bacterium]|nr:hypothetical protein [Cyclobacteriaceae bacterium]